MSADLAQTLIKAVETADSSRRLLESVKQLSEARLEAAVPTLIAVLGYNNPGAAVAAVDGLIWIGKPAVEPLLELLDGYNYSARAWGIRALAGIGDARGLDLLLEAAETDFAMSVRRAATRGLGTLHWDEMPQEQIPPAQAKALQTLLKVSQDEEWVVRYSAITALQELAIATVNSNPTQVLQIVQQFNRLVETEDNSAITARVWLAQKALQQSINELQYSSSAFVSDLISTLEHGCRTTLKALHNHKHHKLVAEAALNRVGEAVSAN
jgi:phycocyanobilin lyase beta subunit